MKRIILGTLVMGTGLVALRRLGPGLQRRMMQKCEGMFEAMPEDFPPKRMMRGIEEIREQNARILQHLEGQEAQPTTTQKDVGGSHVPQQAVAH